MRPGDRTTALAEIVDDCYIAPGAGEPDPGPMAELGISFCDHPIGSFVTGPVFAPDFAEVGVESIEPVITTSGVESTLVFFVYDPELDDFSRATAVRSADGSFSVEYELLG